MGNAGRRQETLSGRFVANFVGRMEVVFLRVRAEPGAGGHVSIGSARLRRVQGRSKRNEGVGGCLPAWAGSVQVVKVSQALRGGWSPGSSHLFLLSLSLLSGPVPLLPYPFAAVIAADHGGCRGPAGVMATEVYTVCQEKTINVV